MSPALDSLADLIGPDAAIKAMDWLVERMTEVCAIRTHAASVMVATDRLPPPSKVAIDSYMEATDDLLAVAESLRYELWLRLCGGAQ